MKKPDARNRQTMAEYDHVIRAGFPHLHQGLRSNIPVSEGETPVFYCQSVENFRRGNIRKRSAVVTPGQRQPGDVLHGSAGAGTVSGHGLPLRKNGSGNGLAAVADDTVDGARSYSISASAAPERR